MATYGTIDLGDSSATWTSGAAFSIDGAAKADFAYVGLHGDVFLKKGSPVVVMRSRTAFTTLDTLLDNAHSDVQRALDVLAITQKYFVSTPNAHLDHALWWRETAGLTLRLQESAPLNVRVEMSWVKTSAKDGAVESSSDAPLPQWHESFRYFRYSQLRNDLYAAYREAFLAVESLLSSYAPRQMQGKALEPEKVWHIRANQQLQAAGIDFGNLARTPGADPVAAFVDEQYVAQRCAHFHAKVSSQHFLPGALGDRRFVADALERLGRYFTEASRAICGASSLVGVMTFGGMQHQINTFATELTLAVSADVTLVKPEDTQVSPAGELVTNIPTIYEGLVDGLGYEHAFLGRIAVQDLATRVVNTIASFVPGALMTRGNVPGLVLDGIQIFEYRQIINFTERAGLKGGFAL